jgi:uncharacterized protein YigE (DUF2233 family)
MMKTANRAGILTTLMLAAGLFAPETAQAECGASEFEGNRFTVCSFDPAVTEFGLFWRDEQSKPYRTFSVLADSLARDGLDLVFAINGGMFQTDFTPVGLHIEDGRELRPPNRSAAPAGMRPVPNFYKKPNGVFYLVDGAAGVLDTETFLQRLPAVDHATQSGPMLVIEGQLHPALIEGSRDRTWRTGVGVSDGGMVHFAISEGHVNFFDFARLFRDGLGTPNALFLDGGRGTGIYAPELGRNDRSWHGGFGPIIGAVKR